MILATCTLLLATAAFADGPEEIPLWPAGAPGFESRRAEAPVAKDYWVGNIHNPSITAFLPPREKATGAAVVICPGGGHRQLVFNAEGVNPARYFNDLGVAAFVLKYRLGREAGSPYKPEVHARQDGLRAMRLVRSRATEWGLDPKRIGIMGFSAGGEVTSMVAYAPVDAAADSAVNPVDRVSSRPDFQILIYPGGMGIPEKVPADAPPAFLLVANDDRGAARAITGLFAKYREAGAPVEAHVFARGGHGFNMGQHSKLETIRHWPDRLTAWLSDNNILDPAKPAKDQK